MTDAHADGASEWDAHWPKVSAWMQTNPAYKYRQKLIWRALGLPAAPVPARVLDIGCGDGSFLRSVNAFRSDIAIAGLEGSGEGLDLARRALPGAVLEQVDLQSLPPMVVDRLRNFVTHALCSEVIEHVDRPIDVLATARPLLAPTGVLVVTVPAGPMSAFDRHVGHRKHYTRDMLRAEAEAAGWQVETLWRTGAPFHTLYRLMVVARGEAAVRDSKGQSGSTTAAASGLAFRVFDALNQHNFDDAPFGWQIVARLRAR